MNPPRFPELPSDLDVLYLHHFAQYLPKPWELWQLLRPFNVYPLDDVLLSHRHTLHRAAMPASAYVVTRQGARKLLSIFNELGLFFQWDSVMLRHSISPSVLKELLPFIYSDQRYLSGATGRECFGYDGTCLAERLRDLPATLPS